MQANRTVWGGRCRTPGTLNPYDSQEKKLQLTPNPILQPLTVAMSVPGNFIVVNNTSTAKLDREDMDDQLAQILIGKALITNQTTGGREPRVVGDEVGYPPSTYSRVFHIPRGGMFNLSSIWENKGLQTLLPFLEVQSPGTQEERRTIVLFGWGPSETLSYVEEEMLMRFDPLSYCPSFGPVTEDGVAHFFMQVELFPNELADSLGIGRESKELETIIKLQTERSRMAIKTSLSSGKNPNQKHSIPNISLSK